MSPLLRPQRKPVLPRLRLVMVLGLVAAVMLFYGADIVRAIRGVVGLIFNTSWSSGIDNKKISGHCKTNER